MPSKKRKYNARFPAGRIKKIMQTDEEVGKVAQAVPIIISRTLELFVESLLGKALRVTMARNAKTLSPSHVRQCILAESRFDFLKDLVRNIPDVSAAEEKEMQLSAESSPTSSRFSDTSASRKIVREDSNSSSSSDVRVHQLPQRAVSGETEPRSRIETGPRTDAVPRIETITTDTAIDLSKKRSDEKPIRTANFYQETLQNLPEVQHKGVIRINPTYGTSQPSTSAKTTEMPKEKFFIDIKQNNNVTNASTLPKTPITPILNIDFTKNLASPEIMVLDTAVANYVGVKEKKSLSRQSKDVKRMPRPLDIDYVNSGNLQIDEDYDT